MKATNDEDQRDALIFSTVESKTSRYFLWTPGEPQQPDHESRELVWRSCTAFIKIFSDHGLLKKSPFDTNGEFADHVYRHGDVTEEAIEMVRRGAESWLDGKSSQKQPLNFQKLDKLLEKIRSEGKNNSSPST